MPWDITSYAPNPDNNTSINGINIAEQCAPSGINNAIRQMMGDIATNATMPDVMTEGTFSSRGPGGVLWTGAPTEDSHAARLGDLKSYVVDQGGMPLFSIFPSLISINRPGFLSLLTNNGDLTAATYPQAYQQVLELSTAEDHSVVTFTQYNAELTANGVCGHFGINETAQTFRIPYIPRMYFRGMGAEMDNIGDFLADQMRPIQGDTAASLQSFHASYLSGAFILSTIRGQALGFAQNENNSIKMRLDSSVLGINYSGPDTHPMSIYVDYKIKMFGVVGQDAQSIGSALTRTWGNIGADATVESSLNVLGVEHAGTGVYNVTFVNAQLNADYAVVQAVDGPCWTTVSNVTAEGFTLSVMDSAQNPIDSPWRFIVQINVEL